MTSVDWIILTGVAVAFITAVVAYIQYSWTRHKLKGEAKRNVLEQWARLQGEKELPRKLLGADAVLDVALAALGYRGTLGDKLKRAGSFIPDVNAVWKAHKIRNRIAHEANVNINERQLEEAIAALERTIHHFCS